MTFNEVNDQLDGWYNAASNWSYFGWALIFLSIVSSAAVSIFTSEITNKQIKILGFISAICSSLLVTFNPIDRSNNFWVAWRIFKSAIWEYEAKNHENENNEDFKKVLDAYLKGEDVIRQSKIVIPTFEPKK